MAVSVGEGVVGLFESKLFFKESSKLPLQALSRPLLVVAMLVVGGWQYTRTRWVYNDATRNNMGAYHMLQPKPAGVHPLVPHLATL